MNLNFAIDETLISHVNNTQLWIIIDIMNKEVRLVLKSTRDEDTIKKFVQDYIENGNTIITDVWRSYNFLDNADSEIQHLVHNHGKGVFGHPQFHVTYRTLLVSNKINYMPNV